MRQAQRKQWNIWKWSTERQSVHNNQHTDETADEYCRQVCANVLFTVNCSEICGRAYTEMLFTVWLYSDCERASEMDKENMQRKNSITISLAPNTPDCPTDITYYIFLSLVFCLVFPYRTSYTESDSKRSSFHYESNHLAFTCIGMRWRRYAYIYIVSESIRFLKMLEHTILHGVFYTFHLNPVALSLFHRVHVHKRIFAWAYASFWSSRIYGEYVLSFLANKHITFCILHSKRTSTTTHFLS